MANRYWVGGTGAWNLSNTLNWSFTTGAVDMTASCTSAGTNTLNVTAVSRGTLIPGMTVFYSNGSNLGTLLFTGSGTGGTGTYTVTAGVALASQDMAASITGASVPTSADSVYIDENSNVGTLAFTITYGDASGPLNCLDFNASGLDNAGAGTLTLTVMGSYSGTNIYGSIFLPTATMSGTSYGPANPALASSTSGKILDFKGRVVVNLYVGTAYPNIGTPIGGGQWSLTSTMSVQNLYLYGGEFNTNGQSVTVSAGNFGTGLQVPLNASQSVTRKLTLGSSTVTIGGQNSWNWEATDSFTILDAGTSTITTTGGMSPRSVRLGTNNTYYNVILSAFSYSPYNFPYNIGNSNGVGVTTFNNLTFAGPSTYGETGYVYRIILSDNIVVNGVLNWNGSSWPNSSAARKIVTSNDGLKKSITVNGSHSNLNNIDFAGIIAGGTAPWIGNNLNDCGDNSGIPFMANTWYYVAKSDAVSNRLIITSNASGGSLSPWATSSGGVGNIMYFPCNQDTIIFDNNSGTSGATIYWTDLYTLGTLNFSSRTTPLTIAWWPSNPQINRTDQNIWGSQPYGGNLIMVSNITGNTSSLITIQPHVVFRNNSPMTIVQNSFGANGFTYSGNSTATLGGSFTMPNVGINSGTFNFNNYDLTVTGQAQLGTGVYGYGPRTTTTLRAINFGTGSLNLTGTYTYNNHSLYGTINDISNLSVTGTANINFSSATSSSIRIDVYNSPSISWSRNNTFNLNVQPTSGSPTFDVTIGNLYDVNLKGTGTYTFTYANFLGNLNIAASGPIVSGGTFNTYGTDATATQKITTSGQRLYNLTITNVGGSTVQLQDVLLTNSLNLTQGTLDLTLANAITTTFSANGDSSRSIKFGTNYLTANTAITMPWTSNMTITGTGGIYSNANVAPTINISSVAGNVAPNVYVYTGSAALTITSNSQFGNLDFTGYSGTVSTGNIKIARSLVLSSGGTFTGVTVNAIGNGIVKTLGKTISNFIANSTSSANITLVDQLNTTAGVNMVAGNLVVAGNINTTTFTGIGGNVTLVDAMLNVSASGNAFTVTGLSSFAGTTASNITLASASAKSFVGNGIAYPTINQGGAGNLTIYGSNSFANITSNVLPANIFFGSGTTTTISNFGLKGAAGTYVGLRSATAGSQFTISKSSGTVSTDYLIIKDSIASGGANWQPGTNTINAGNNLGWFYSASQMMALFF